MSLTDSVNKFLLSVCNCFKSPIFSNSLSNWIQVVLIASNIYFFYGEVLVSI